MQGVTDYENQGDLTHPANQVVALLPCEADVAEIVIDLHKAGFEADEIGVLHGQHDIHKVDAAPGNERWFTRLKHFGPGFGALDPDHLQQYVIAIQNNETVIAVEATRASKRWEVVDLLKEHGARLINFVKRI